MHTNSGQRLYFNPFILIYTPIQAYAFSEAAELQGPGQASQNRQENANFGDAYSPLLMLMKMKRIDTLLKFLRTCPHDADCTDVLCRFYSLFNHPLIQKANQFASVRIDWLILLYVENYPN